MRSWKKSISELKCLDNLCHYPKGTKISVYLLTLCEKKRTYIIACRQNASFRPSGFYQFHETDHLQTSVFLCFLNRGWLQGIPQFSPCEDMMCTLVAVAVGFQTSYHYGNASWDKSTWLEVFDEFEADIIKAAFKNKLFSVNMCKTDFLKPGTPQNTINHWQHDLLLNWANLLCHDWRDVSATSATIWNITGHATSETLENSWSLIIDMIIAAMYY